MKRLLILSVTMLLASCVFAANTPVTMGTTQTITNAGTVSVTTTVNGTYETISIQPIVTKVSGTVAGNVYVSASVDGTNFVIISDSLSLSNTTTNTKIWVFNNSNYKYYRVTAVGSGTMSATMSCKLFPTPSSGSHAVVNMLSEFNASTDTVDNTATGYVQYQIKGWYETVSIQAVVTKLSGTAAGTVTLQGSNDGTNFVTVSSSYASATTLSVSNVTTNTKIFIVTGSPYSYYRLSYTGSGTMSCKLNGLLMGNKK